LTEALAHRVGASSIRRFWTLAIPLAERTPSGHSALSDRALARLLSSEVMTTRVVDVEILPSARKHGVSDDDIRHGLDNAVAAITTTDQHDFTMIVGANLNGHLLEIGVLAADDNDYVIHAMPARTKYLKMIKPKRGGQP